MARQALFDPLEVIFVALEMVLEHAALVQDCHIADVAADVNLVLTDHAPVEIRDPVAVVYQFLSIEVNGSVINSELIQPEKWNCSIVKV